MGNPLVADVISTDTWHTGAGALDYAVTAAEDAASGDFLGAGLNTLAAGLGALGAIVDPLGAIFAAGVGWVMEHVSCFRDFLDWLAGKPDVITASASTWNNISERLNTTAQEVLDTLRNDTARWNSPSISAYRLSMVDHATHLKAAAVAAGGVSGAVGLAGLLVATVRTTVRDIIADAIGKIISKALQALTVVLIPKVAVEIGIMVADYSSKIMNLIKRLIDGIQKIGSKMGKLKPVFEGLHRHASKWAHANDLAIIRMRTGYHSANNGAHLFNWDANGLKKFSSAYGALFRSGAGGDWSTSLGTAAIDSLKGTGGAAVENAVLNGATQTQDRTADSTLNGGKLILPL